MKCVEHKLPPKPIREMSAALWRDICYEYAQPHRHFHNIDHVLDIVALIDKRVNNKDLAETLKWAACFHDIVYDPRSKKNEQDSVLIFINMLDKHAKSLPNSLLDQRVVRSINQIILDTAVLNIEGDASLGHASNLFNTLDRAAVAQSSLTELFAYGEKIYKEYAFVDYSEFVTKHLEIVTKIRHNDVPVYGDWLRSRRIRVGLYAGSFNPFHLGHYDVFQQASKVFDKVIVAVGQNPEKVGSDTVSQTQVTNLSLGSSHLGSNYVDWNLPLNTHVIKFTGTLDALVAHYKKQEPNYDLTIVKGVRNANDLEHESSQRKFLRDFDPTIKHTYFIADSRFSHISSSALRALKSLGKEIDDYVP